MKTKKVFLSISLILCLGFISYFGRHYYVKFEEAKRQQFLYARRKTAWQSLEREISAEINQFKGEVGIVIKDLQTGWEISYAKDKLFPSASLAKVPIMAASFLASEEDKLKLERNIALRSQDKLTGSGLLKDVRPGATFAVGDLIGFMIYDSDNTATNMLTNILGIDYLDKAFKTFGLKNTNLSRRVADFSLRDKGIENYTTAEDMALILEKIYLKSLVNKNVSEKCLRLLKLQRVNDRIPKYLPAELTIAHKTGLERHICHDSGLVFTRKGNFLIVVLTKHANPNSVPSKEFIAKAASSVYNYFGQLP